MDRVFARGEAAPLAVLDYIQAFYNRGHALGVGPPITHQIMKCSSVAWICALDPLAEPGSLHSDPRSRCLWFQRPISRVIRCSRCAPWPNELAVASSIGHTRLVIVGMKPG